MCDVPFIFEILWGIRNFRPVYMLFREKIVWRTNCGGGNVDLQMWQRMWRVAHSCVEVAAVAPTFN